MEGQQPEEEAAAAANTTWAGQQVDTAHLTGVCCGRSRGTSEGQNQSVVAGDGLTLMEARVRTGNFFASLIDEDFDQQDPSDNDAVAAVWAAATAEMWEEIDADQEAADLLDFAINY